MSQYFFYKLHKITTQGTTDITLLSVNITLYTVFILKGLTQIRKLYEQKNLTNQGKIISVLNLWATRKKKFSKSQCIIITSRSYPY